ncbi:hypothetical protein HD806DRAFT_145170 [Xylariaceae sp. AK1471]|nr:hypothetical protein HD806DRAFT_145170 [Xylariaceae sp. AK1471]
MALHWDQYFAEQDREILFSENLREQLHDSSDAIFSSGSADFLVVDIADDKSKSTLVRGEDELKTIVEDPPASGTRIISIPSARTIAPLKIQSEYAAKVFRSHGVHPNFLRVLLSFGDEPHLSEASSSNTSYTASDDGSYTLFYKLNYVEKNHRSGPAVWSFRHVGVYHYHTPAWDMILLLHCSPTSALNGRLLDMVRNEDQGKHSRTGLHMIHKDPCVIHQLVLSCYVDNWRPYIRHLGDQFSKINNLAMVQTAELTDQESFVHVQKLRNVIDFSMFANGCCTSNLKIVKCLESAGSAISGSPRTFSSTRTILEEYIDSSQGLQARIQNTIDLIGYTLTLHNQLETARFDKEIRDMTQEMKNLAQETGVITRKLKELAQNTVDDSSIVRVITIVSAFYLPGSFLGTIFGMNFFGFDSNQHQITIATDFWIFIIFWVVLTIITGGLFYFTYLRSSWRKTEERKSRI